MKSPLQRRCLGTGLLDADQAAAVAARLVSPDMSSGFGLRTMSTDSAGYWSAAAAVVVLGASLGLDVTDGALVATPGALGTAVAADGLVFRGARVSVDGSGAVTHTPVVALRQAQ